jgi:hypothetical protein
MFYVLHGHEDFIGRSERLAQQLRDSGYEVSDVRASDCSPPDSGSTPAGKYWTSAQITMKLCDMIPTFQKEDVFVITDPLDEISHIVLHNLNIHYQLGATIYVFVDNEFVDISSMVPYNINELEQKLEDENA